MVLNWSFAGLRVFLSALNYSQVYTILFVDYWSIKNNLIRRLFKNHKLVSLVYFVWVWREKQKRLFKRSKTLFTFFASYQNISFYFWISQYFNKLAWNFLFATEHHQNGNDILINLHNNRLIDVILPLIMILYKLILCS